MAKNGNGKFDTNPVWTSMEGSRKLAAMNRGWKIALTRFDNSTQKQIDEADAAWRAFDAKPEAKSA